MSLYDVLGVVPASDAAAVRRAYVALARQHHPDRAGGDAAQMRAINDAWAVLGDPHRRAQYDRSLAHPDPVAPSSAGEQSWTSHVDDDRFDDDLLDDRPIHAGTVRVPRWLGLIPAALFCTAVGALVLGLVLSVPTLVGLGAMAFVLSCLFFLAAPFVALFAARAGEGRARARR